MDVKHSKISGTISNPAYDVKIDVRIAEFEEDGIWHFIAPQLDIIGTGNTLKEAKKSFETSLEITFDYVLKKGTLKKYLESLGWTVSIQKKKTKFDAPDFSKLLINNDDWRSVVNSGVPVNLLNKSISFPSIAA